MITDAVQPDAAQCQKIVTAVAVNEKIVKDKFQDDLLDNCSDQLEQDVTATVKSDLINKRKIKLDQALSEHECAQLKALFPDLRFDVSDAHDSEGHYFARAIRNLTVPHFKNVFCLNTELTKKVPVGNYHVIWKDIGSNPMQFLREEIDGVHHCCPTLSATDVVRRSTFRTVVNGIESSTLTGVKRRIVDGWEGDLAICHVKAEYCNIRAPYLSFVHSTYDISIESLLTILDRSECQVALGVILFDPIVLVLESGVIPSVGAHFKKFIRDGEKYIRFTFLNDCQAGYEHRYSTYIALISTFVIRSDVTGATYVVSTDRQGSGHLFFRIVRCFTPLSKSTIFRTFDFGKRDYKIIYTYDIDDSVMAMGTLKRVRLVVSTFLYERLLAHALTTSEGRFTLKSIFVSACAFNQRIVVNGVNVSNPVSLEPLRLGLLCVAVYITAYDANYKNMQTLNVLKNDIEDEREGDVVFDLNFFRSIWNSCFNEDVDAVDEHEKVKVFEDSKKNWEKVSSRCIKLIDVFLGKRKYPISVNDPVRLVEFEDEVAVEMEGIDSPEKPFELLSYLNPPKESVRSMMKAVDSDKENFNCSVQGVTISHRTCCDDVETLEEKPTPGDGDCLFHALKLSGATTLTPPVLRKYIATDKVLSPNKIKLLTCYDPMNIYAENWGTDEHIESFVRLTGVSICIHFDDGTFKFFERSGERAGVTFHLKYSHFHWTALVKKEFASTVQVHYSVKSVEPIYFPDQGETESFFTKLFEPSTTENPHLTISKKNYKTFRYLTDPLSDLNRGGFVCRSAFKIIELDILGHVPHDANIVLDLGAGPGGWTQYMLEQTSAKVLGVTKHVPMAEEIQKERRFTEILPLDGECDLITEEGFAAIDRVINRHVEGKIPLVLADGCVENDQNDSLIRVEANSQLKTNELKMAMKWLSADGVFIQKLFDPSSPITREHLKSICQSFQDVVGIFLTTSHKTSLEFFVVAAFPVTNTRHVPEVAIQNFSNKLTEILINRRMSIAVPLKRFALDPTNVKVQNNLKSSTRDKNLVEAIKRRCPKMIVAGGYSGFEKVTNWLKSFRTDSNTPENLRPDATIPVVVDGFEFRTPEMAFYYLKVKAVLTPVIAETLKTTSTEVPLRYKRVLQTIDSKDWDAEEYNVLKSVAANIPTNDLKQLKHGDLIYDGEDPVLGIGRFGGGKNLWGKVLSELRSEIKEEEHNVPQVEEAVIEPSIYSSCVESIDTKIGKPIVINQEPVETKPPPPQTVGYVTKYYVDKTKTTIGGALIISSFVAYQYFNKPVEIVDDSTSIINICLKKLTVVEVDRYWFSQIMVSKTSKWSVGFENFNKPAVDTLVETSGFSFTKILRFLSPTALSSWLLSSADISDLFVTKKRDKIIWKRFSKGAMITGIASTIVCFLSKSRVTYFTDTVVVHPLKFLSKLFPKKVVKFFPDYSFQQSLAVIAGVVGVGLIACAIRVRKELVILPPAKEPEGNLSMGPNIKTVVLKSKPQQTRHEVVENSKNTSESPLTKSLEEFKVYCKMTNESEESNHQRALDIFNNHPNGSTNITREPGGYGILSKLNNFITPSNEPLENYRMKYSKSTGFVPVTSLVDDLSVVSEYSRLALDGDIYEAIKDLKVETFPKTTIVQAGPGSGKTTTIIEKAANMPNSMILCSTREGKVDVRSRLKKKINCNDAVLRQRVRTVASVLLNGGSCAPESTLFIDEGLMQHPGAIVAAVLILKPAEVEIYGDHLQIPFVNRLGTICPVTVILPDLFETSRSMTVTRRCPPDVAYRLNDQYQALTGEVFKSTVPIKTNTCTLEKFVDVKTIPQGDVVLTFTQSDKQTLVSTGLKNVSTIHEFQGKEAENVVVVRTSRIPTDEIYKRLPYATVAISRHKKSLVYVTPVETDALSELIKNKPDPSVIEKHSILSAGYTSGTIVQSDDIRIIGTFHKEKQQNMVSVGFANTDIVLPEPFSLKALKKSFIFSENPVVYDLSEIASNTRIVQEFVSTVNRIEKQKEHKSSFYSSSRINFRRPVIDDIIEKNGLLDFPNYTLEQDEVHVGPKVDTPLVSIKTDGGSISTLQDILYQRFGCRSLEDQSYDTWMVHTEPLEVIAKDCTLTAKGEYRQPRFEKFNPKLHAPSQLLRPVTQVESILATGKRNMCVPELMGSIDIRGESSKMLDAFIEKYTTLNTKSAFVDQIRVSSESITEWFLKQPPVVQKHLEINNSIYDKALNTYKFCIKRQPKPSLDEDAASQYPALQTILHHEKEVNAIFCPIFQELKKRLFAFSKRNYLILTDCAPEEFARKLEDLFPPYIAKNFKTLEMDFSKFDKSQSALVLEFEMKFMRFFGVPEDLVILWGNAHSFCRAYDPSTGISFKTAYQRKTGDASTFFFNTIFVMGMMAHYFKGISNEPEFSLFAGDDSLLFFKDMPDVDSTAFAFTYNMELKTFTYENPHFCSKFLLFDENNWYFLPDPVKLCVKLARKDLKNQEHIEMYRISCVDLAKSLDNYFAAELLTAAVYERYGVFVDGVEFARSYLHLTGNRQSFSDLFYTDFPALIDDRPLSDQIYNYEF